MTTLSNEELQTAIDATADRVVHATTYGHPAPAWERHLTALLAEQLNRTHEIETKPVPVESEVIPEIVADKKFETVLFLLDQLGWNLCRPSPNYMVLRRRLVGARPPGD